MVTSYRVAQFKSMAANLAPSPIDPSGYQKYVHDTKDYETHRVSCLNFPLQLQIQISHFILGSRSASFCFAIHEFENISRVYTVVFLAFRTSPGFAETRI